MENQPDKGPQSWPERFARGSETGSDEDVSVPEDNGRHGAEAPNSTERGGARLRREQQAAQRESSQALFRNIRVVGFAMYLPLAMVVGPIVGFYLGQWIGEQVGSVFWGRILGVVFGLAAAVQQVVFVIRRLLRELR